MSTYAVFFYCENHSKEEIQETKNRIKKTNTGRHEKMIGPTEEEDKLKDCPQKAFCKYCMQTVWYLDKDPICDTCEEKYND